MQQLSLRHHAAPAFRSFWMGGFEAASHVNPQGHRLDMIAGTHHDRRLLEDYRLLRDQGLLVMREALRWHLIETAPNQYDFSTFHQMLDAAQKAGIQGIWTLCHYGFPRDLDIFSRNFVDRFAQFARAAGTIFREHSDEIPLYAPINEISFFCWAATRRVMYPFAEGRDDELKRQLVRASIAACRELRDVDPRCRFVQPEPIIHVVPPLDRPDLAGSAQQQTESQFEAWDMLAGMRDPDLGGDSTMLDVVGVNFYHSNQWEFNNGRLVWEQDPRDHRWAPFSRMLETVWKRYQRPLIVAETSHVGIGRADWITEIADEVVKARSRGVPVEGICLFPIIDRFDWNDPNHWHNSGLWDIDYADGSFNRRINTPYILALQKARSGLPR